MTDLLHRMHHDLRRLARENERLREEVANAATAERARLAGMAPDDMRKLVCHFEDVVTDRVRETERGERYCHPDTGWDTPTRAVDVTSVRTTLLARLAAARGEDDLLPACCGEYGVKRMAYCGACPLDEALAAYVGNPAQRRIVLDRLTTLRARLAAVEGERERVMADYASELAMIFADRKADRMELLAKAAAVEEQVRLHEATIERQAEAIGILQRAESEAERRGAERAAQYCQTTAVVRHGITDYKDMADELANEIRALFPPPGAEVGRG